MGARLGSLDRGGRTLPGQRGRIDIAPVLRQDGKVQCKSEALLGSGKVSGAGGKLSIEGERIGRSSRRRTEASERAGRQPALWTGEFLS